MMIKASGRSALMVVTGLFVCLAGVSYTTAATEAASSKSESATATKSVKQGTRHWKRYAHRKYVRTAQKSSPVKKAEEKEVADATGEMPVSLSYGVANANARFEDEPSGTAKAMTERANAILLAQAADNKADNQPADAQAPAASPVLPPDQLNEVDRTLQEAKRLLRYRPALRRHRQSRWQPQPSRPARPRPRRPSAMTARPGMRPH